MSLFHLCVYYDAALSHAEIHTHTRDVREKKIFMQLRRVASPEEFYEYNNKQKAREDAMR